MICFIFLSHTFLTKADGEGEFTFSFLFVCERKPNKLLKKMSEIKVAEILCEFGDVFNLVFSQKRQLIGALLLGNCTA